MVFEPAECLAGFESVLGRHFFKLERSTNQHRQSVLRVRPEFWPYARIEGTAKAAAPSLTGERSRTTETRGVGRRESGPGRQPRPAAAAEAACLNKVREALIPPSCVQGRFGPADERVAPRRGAAVERPAGNPAGQRPQVRLDDQLEGVPAGGQPAIPCNESAGSSRRRMAAGLLAAPGVSP